MNNNQKTQSVLLGIILLVGFILRFWDYWNIPFMFDELSAMGRTTYDSFSELIQHGVIERDSHPAGVQVFLFYWIKFFGDSEPVVKLPFLLAGIASVYLSYRVGELWFCKTTGILTAAFVSSLQLFVMYSQIARPYISGLFITLLMVFFWSRYFFYKPKIKYLIWFAVFGALAAYNHYFSLLFAATVGVSGLLLVNRKTAILYILSGVVIFLLYIPHLDIFFAQAEKGTIGGWLGEPGQYFFFKFFYWLFHKSVFSIGLFLMILIVGVFIGQPLTDETALRIRKRLILVIWLLPAPIFGYVYSYTVEPILQNSLLIFTIPYLFMLVISFVGNFSVKQQSVAVVIILLVNSLTLIIVRDYYHLFYKQPFKNMAESSMALESIYPEDVFIISDYTPYYMEYYFNANKRKQIPYFTTRNADLNLVEFDSAVGVIEQNIVITSGIEDQYFQIIKKHFPNWIGFDAGFTFEQYTFSRKPLENIEGLQSKLIASTNFNQENGDWSYSDKNLVFDSILDNSKYLFAGKNEWGPKCTFKFDSISQSGYVIIDVEIEIETIDDTCEALLVAEIKRGKEKLSWRGYEFKEFNFKKGTRKKFFATVDVQKSLNDNMDIHACTMEIFVWNPKHNNFWINQILISSRPGNPERYTL